MGATLPNFAAKKFDSQKVDHRLLCLQHVYIEGSPVTRVWHFSTRSPVCTSKKPCVMVCTTKNVWYAGVHRLFFPVVVKICEFAFYRKNARHFTVKMHMKYTVEDSASFYLYICQVRFIISQIIHTQLCFFLSADIFDGTTPSHTHLNCHTQKYGCATGFA